MKGILLAGGSGTRLYPTTVAVSKQLLPIYDKPTIYYPLSVLMLAGIKEVLIISTPRDIPRIEELLGTGKNLGMRFEYCIQERPEGIAQALILAERFLNGSPSCLILGDNVFYGHALPQQVETASRLTHGSIIFGYHVNDPERYGVVEFDPTSKKVIDIEEKPKLPKSNIAVTGLYFYDGHASEYAKALKPSARGELEITELNRVYLKKNQLKLELFGRGVAWLDSGTPESLLEASHFVRTVQERQGLKVSCIEEIALTKKFITKSELTALAEKMPKSEYSRYLLNQVKNIELMGLS